MVQESIVEYINSQMKAGVSRDAIKTTLTGAGWQAADVEDTLKKVEGGKPATPAAAQPVSAMPMSSPAGAKSAMSGGTSGMAAGPGPQTIRVSDLVSAAPASAMPATKSSSPSSVPTGIAMPATSKSPLTGPSKQPASSAPASSAQASAMPAGGMMGAMKSHGSRGTLITEIVLVVIILAIGGFAGFLFMQNNSLNAQLSSLNGQSSGVNSQLSALQAQVAASTTALAAQVSTLTAANQDLQTELSFLAAPAGATPGVTSTATISGTVSAVKTTYFITTADDVKITVANSKAASVIAALEPLMAPAAATSTAASAATSTAASSTTATSPAPTTPATSQFTGTYVPGSDSITLTSVNGTSL